jgi:hypothetical protein
MYETAHGEEEEGSGHEKTINKSVTPHKRQSATAPRSDWSVPKKMEKLQATALSWPKLRSLLLSLV